MTEPIDEKVQKAALTIMNARNCGLIVDGVTVLCCDPRAAYLEERAHCSCWASAVAAMR